MSGEAGPSNGSRVELKCPTCGRVFSGKNKYGVSSNLARHMRLHSGEKPYSCALCGDAFTTSGNLKRHMNAAHVSPSLRPAPTECACDVCGKKFAWRQNMLAHKQRQHPPTPTQSTLDDGAPRPTSVQREWSCGDCGATLASKSKLARHLRLHCPFREDVSLPPAAAAGAAVAKRPSHKQAVRERRKQRREAIIKAGRSSSSSSSSASTSLSSRSSQVSDTASDDGDDENVGGDPLELPRQAVMMQVELSDGSIFTVSGGGGGGGGAGDGSGGMRSPAETRLCDLLEGDEAEEFAAFDRARKNRKERRAAAKRDRCEASDSEEINDSDNEANDDDDDVSTTVGGFGMATNATAEHRLSSSSITSATAKPSHDVVEKQSPIVRARRMRGETYACPADGCFCSYAKRRNLRRHIKSQHEGDAEQLLALLQC